MKLFKISSLLFLIIFLVGCSKGQAKETETKNRCDKKFILTDRLHISGYNLEIHVCSFKPEENVTCFFIDGSGLSCIKN